MMVTLNGEPREVSGDLTIRGLLRELGLEGAAIAVAVNSEFVPRTEHETHTLQAGDAIELVAPQQGG